MSSLDKVWRCSKKPVGQNLSCLPKLKGKPVRWNVNFGFRFGRTDDIESCSWVRRRNSTVILVEIHCTTNSWNLKLVSVKTHDLSSVHIPVRVPWSQCVAHHFEGGSHPTVGK